MSLEAMKKDDLVKHARTLEQENKELKSQIDELKSKVSTNKKLTNLTAVSLIPSSKTFHIKYVELKYNLNGEATIVKEVELEPHKAVFRAEETLARMEKTNKNKE